MAGAAGGSSFSSQPPSEDTHLRLLGPSAGVTIVPRDTMMRANAMELGKCASTPVVGLSAGPAVAIGPSAPESLSQAWAFSSENSRGVLHILSAHDPVIPLCKQHQRVPCVDWAAKLQRGQLVVDAVATGRNFCPRCVQKASVHDRAAIRAVISPHAARMLRID